MTTQKKHFMATLLDNRRLDILKKRGLTMTGVNTFCSQLLRFWVFVATNDDSKYTSFLCPTHYPQQEGCVGGKNVQEHTLYQASTRHASKNALYAVFAFLTELPAAVA